MTTVRQTSSDGALVGDLIKGALAGAAGTWAMDLVTWFMMDREDPRALEQERQARPEGLDPAHSIANRLAHAVSRELSPRQPHPAGIAAHFAIGVLPAALYAVARKRVPQVRTGRGLLYGLALFVMQDEIVNSLLGTAGPPGDYPRQAHVRGLVGHLVYGAVTEAAANILDQLTERTSVEWLEPRQVHRSADTLDRVTEPA